MKYFLSIACLILFSWAIQAQKNLEKFLQDSALIRANVGLMIIDDTGKLIADNNSHKCLVPASTMKIVTSATALEMLGPDFRFKTRLLIDGIVTSKGVLDGNLIILGNGDPTLGSEKIGDKVFLQKWTEAVRSAGIKKIKGDIIVDESLFEKQGINPKWIWEDLANYYGSGIYAISYLDNTIKVYFRSDSIGSTPKIIRKEPDISEFKVDNYLKSSSTMSDLAFFYGDPNSYQRSIYGEIPSYRNEFLVKASNPNPGLTLASCFAKHLVNNGIKILGHLQVVYQKHLSTKNIYTHYSPPLREIISEINYHSNNLYAECLFKYIGIRYDSLATAECATQKIKEFWKSKGLSIDELIQYDGSGLAPKNGVSPNFLSEILNYMRYKSQNSKLFFDSFPTAGETGTLSKFLKNTILSGKVKAKSGSMDLVKSYAGYIDSDKKKYIFCVIVNNYQCSQYDLVRKLENLLVDCITVEK